MEECEICFMVLPYSVSTELSLYLNHFSKIFPEGHCLTKTKVLCWLS